MEDRIEREREKERKRKREERREKRETIWLSPGKIASAATRVK